MYYPRIYYTVIDNEPNWESRVEELIVWYQQRDAIRRSCERPVS